MLDGAGSLLATAKELGLELCLANPGTTELPLVRALDTVGGIRSVLGLHENVCTGAADGYARLAGKPAMTLLHLGPGFANGVANLHNARRAFSPVINFIGEHASWHRSADPPLHSDIESLARAVSGWTRRVNGANECARDMRDALSAATSRRGAVATLILPHDHLSAPADRPVPGSERPAAYPRIDDDLVERAARLLSGAKAPAVLLGGTGLFGHGLAAAGRLGVTLISEVSFARLESGQGLPPLIRLPYFPEAAQAMLDRHDAVVVCGARMPVSFFGYEDKPSRYLDGRADVVHLAGQEDDAVTALEALADALGQPLSRSIVPAEPEARSMAPSMRLDAAAVAQVLCNRMPEDAIAVVTAVTSGQAFYERSTGARPHTQIALTGGAIGEGSALALGAALAVPDRRIVSLEADGSAAYIVQALYSQAREGLDITTVICANARYRILEVELARAGLERPGPIASRLAELDRPPIDWVAVAKGFGVPGSRAVTVEELDAAVRRSLATPGPALIEAVL